MRLRALVDLCGLFLLLIGRYAFAAEPLPLESLQSPGTNLVYIALQHTLYDGDQRVLNAAPKPLDFYAHSILVVNYPPVDELAADPAASAGTLEPLDTLEDKRVFTVSYPSGLVAILVERQQDRFLPVMYVHRRAPIEMMEIVSVEGNQFLAYIADLIGTGNPKEEYYFALVDGAPVRVDYNIAMNAELTLRLPADHGVWKGGGFDIRSLTFTQSVWKTRDDNASPSGGRIEMNFDFTDDAFVVESSTWYPAAMP